MARILIVEDNESNAEIATAILANAGHETVWAANGHDALDALAGDPFDVVVMDVLMPGLDGLSATRMIRRDPRHALLPVIGLTAVVDPTMGQTLRAAGMNAVLTKPYRNREFRDLVESFLVRPTGPMVGQRGLPSP